MAPSTQQQQASHFDGPPYEADWIIDEAHRPETIIEKHGRNAQSPAAHDVYKRTVQEKAEKFGVIHLDPATGYRARFKPQGSGRRGDAGGTGDQTARGTGASGAGDQGGGQGAGGGGGRDQANGRTAGGRGRTRDQGGAGGGQATDDSAAKIAELERQLAEARGQGGGGQ